MSNPRLDLRICTECDVQHFDNCPQCFGFGVYKSTGGPMGSAKAISTKSSVACPVCKSDYKGVPNV